MVAAARKTGLPLAILLIAVYLTAYVCMGTTWEFLGVNAEGQNTVEGISRDYARPGLAEFFGPAAWLESLLTGRSVETSSFFPN